MSRFTTTVRGRSFEWEVYVAERSVDDMRKDGIEVHEIINTIPVGVVEAGLAAPWVAAQDVWNLPTALWRWLKGKK